MAETPVEVMRTAFDSEFDLWSLSLESDEYKIFRDVPDGKGGQTELMFTTCDDSGNDLFDKMRWEAGLRAALRALAEMEPTERMIFGHGKAMGEVVAAGKALMSAETMMAGFRGALLCAAAEGEEDLSRIDLPSSTGREC